jgi:hypothetical protein
MPGNHGTVCTILTTFLRNLPSLQLLPVDLSFDFGTVVKVRMVLVGWSKFYVM